LIKKKLNFRVKIYLEAFGNNQEEKTLLYSNIVCILFNLNLIREVQTMYVKFVYTHKYKYK
jgi:hypothetical protein